MRFGAEAFQNLSHGCHRPLTHHVAAQVHERNPAGTCCPATQQRHVLGMLRRIGARTIAKRRIIAEGNDQSGAG